ncbi:MAG TPA: alginate lyase family protein [Arachnia sp.]|nr:alginate lyase family protein [Arachnia sp.]HMT85786.1 alginate lyase family protein [Arachnia sp.]
MTSHAAPMTPEGLDRIPRRGALSRRSLLAGAALALPVSALGTTLVSPLSAAAAGETGGPFAHPGLLHSQADLDQVSALIGSGGEPWGEGWVRLLSSPHASANWASRETPLVVRGGTGENYPILYRDIHAAYQNALQWRLAGEQAHGDRAVAILNAWSSTLTQIGGNADRFLASGIYGYQFANAAELVRDHPDFDQQGAEDVLLDVFYPLADDFLVRHNGAVITNYWANWDLANMCAVLAIGIFADRTDLVDQAIDYFYNGAGNGSIAHAVPFVYESEGLAQWQESGRDQAHTVLGIGLMGAFCEMAWQQGYDCYGALDNRFLKGAEYVAKYNLGEDVPFTTYTWQSGPAATTAPHAGWASQTVISDAVRGHLRPVWELVAGHYVGRRGLSAPWVSQMAEQVRVEGGGGQYGPNSGGYDQLGFGTLLHYPRVLMGVSATAVTRCVAGKVVVALTITGDGAHAVRATASGDFGSKEIGPIQPGRKASVSLSTRATAIADGQIALTVRAVDDASLVRSLVVPVGAASCQ